jgi:hypothetical protein
MKNTPAYFDGVKKKNYFITVTLAKERKTVKKVNK